MKKILYMTSMAVAVLFSSCTEDKGTSTEVADSNEGEVVNPDHLNNYNKPGTASYINVPFNAGTQANAADQDVSAVDIVFAYYTKNNAEQYYNFNSIKYMGGNAREVNNTMNRDKLNTDSNENSGTTMAPGTTTADGQPSSATNTGSKTSKKKKERLTPYEDKKD